jgi:hypothetical protein
MTESLAARTAGWAGIILLLVGFTFYALNFRQGPMETVHGTLLSSSVLPSDDPAPLPWLRLGFLMGVSSPLRPFMACRHQGHSFLFACIGKP